MLRTDDAHFADFAEYLRHKWIVMLTFWRAMSDFGTRLQWHDLHNTALICENVREGLGFGDASEAHPVKHYELLREIGIDVHWDDEPEFIETNEYINFRQFCVRHSSLAWGLGSVFSQGANVARVHAWLLRAVTSIRCRRGQRRDLLRARRDQC